MEGATNKSAMVRPVWAEMDLTALEDNYREVCRRVGPKVKVIASLKANAYGHGVVEVARVLSAQGAFALACGSFHDALAIRRAGIRAKLLLFGSYLPQMVPELLQHDLIPTVYNMETALAISEAARAPAPVYIKVDAGLGRLGVPAAEAAAFVRSVATLPRVVVEGLYTHLPFGDARGLAWARERLSQFQTLIQALTAEGLSISVTQAMSSAGILTIPDHGCNAVCPGHLLYGVSPLSPEVADLSGFRPVLRAIKTQLIHVMVHRTTDVRGYGGRYTLPAGTGTGVVPIGLSDGYRTARVGKGVMLLRGQRIGVLSVGLEHATLNLTGVPRPEIGEQVVVLGEQGEDRITLEEMAAWQGVGPPEVLASFNDRIPHVA